LAQFSAKTPSVVAKAPETLLWLVTFAEARQTVTYGDLSHLVHVHWRTVLPHVLGTIGYALKKLSADIPPIQLLVVNSSTKIPGDEGLGFMLDKERLASLSQEDKRIQWEVAKEKVFDWNWRDVLKQFGLTPRLPDDEEEAAIATFGYEGRIVVKLQIHRHRERDSALTKAKKAEAENKYGKLSCEVCGFLFTARYGQHGSGFIECHHREPLKTITGGGKKVRLEDLALVCANCHRMLHRKDWPSIDQLRLRLLPQ
jgi:hypothetical protein